MQFIRALAIALGVMVPALAFAEPGAVRGACLNDIKTLCAGVQPGGGRIRDCIKQHRSELSQGCKMALMERIMARRQSRQGQGGGPGAPNQGNE
jgi:hypothetical protein